MTTFFLNCMWKCAKIFFNNLTPKNGLFSQSQTTKNRTLKVTLSHVQTQNCYFQPWLKPPKLLAFEPWTKHIKYMTFSHEQKTHQLFDKKLGFNPWIKPTIDRHNSLINLKIEVLWKMFDCMKIISCLCLWCDNPWLKHSLVWEHV